MKLKLGSKSLVLQLKERYVRAPAHAGTSLSLRMNEDEFKDCRGSGLTNSNLTGFVSEADSDGCIYGYMPCSECRL